MDTISEAGAPYIHARTPEAGGAGGSGSPTALGVYHGIRATREYPYGDDAVRGRRVLVQGAGGVGRKLIERLRAEGAEVLFSDVVESAIAWGRDEVGLEFVSPAEVYDTPCDLFSPCALGGRAEPEHDSPLALPGGRGCGQ
jgi:leucine dehydrogenase